MFMIRRGPYKYIHCDTDSPLLFDVVADPLERSNLVGVPEHADRAAAFAAEVGARWDSTALREQVVASQRSRRVLHAAMSKGPLVSWDHLPINDVAHRYVRNHQDWAEAGPKMRYPQLPNEVDG
jgi:choline-sulfatase